MMYLRTYIPVRIAERAVDCVVAIIVRGSDQIRGNRSGTVASGLKTCGKANLVPVSVLKPKNGIKLLCTSLRVNQYE